LVLFFKKEQERKRFFLKKEAKTFTCSVGLRLRLSWLGAFPLGTRA
jgi:hypothetical protein